MRQIWAIASRELRGYFGSPVALIFLGTFLLANLFTFFWVEQFFARNIADVRPLFDWLPILLILLVSALTMRLWSEEQKMGTVEVLLTLPVPLHRLVLGKFLAGFLLVAIALGMTLGLPITVSFMGELDWGPVVGGYVGALLLAAAYLAVGLCVSATTSNQIVALLLTGVTCALLYLPGADAITGLVSNDAAALLRSLGTGSRFESIARGVLDMRDLSYYAALVGSFLVLNTAILAAKRWSRVTGGGRRHAATKLAIYLTLANFVALNVWLAPIGSARLDLTERGDYSLSEVTEDVLASLDEPLVIRGYVSKRTHPLLAPLVPQVRDRLAEYDVVGGAGVTVEFVDPREDEDVEKEAYETYGIKPVPFRVADRHEDAVVNSYFHILVQYGDQHEVLAFDDLIEIKVSGMNDIEVELRNLEYDVTRAIKKVAYGFQSTDALFASLSDEVVLTAYLTPDSLPEEYREVPKHIEAVAAELSEASGGKFRLDVVQPSSREQMEDLYRRYGLQPYAVSLFSDDSFYMHLLLQMGGGVHRVLPAEDMSEPAIRDAVIATLERAAPGFLKTVGLVTPPAGGAMHPEFGMGMGPAGGPSYEMLREHLGESYEVESVDLARGSVPGDVDVLVVAAPDQLGDKERFAIDQFLMRGGPTIVLGSAFRLGNSSDLRMEKRETGLESLLRHYGVDLHDQLVLDPQNAAFPIPVKREIGGGLAVEEIHAIPYPFFVDVRPDGMAEDDLRVKGLAGVTLQWASPVRLTDAISETRTNDGTGENVLGTVLLSSSERAWLQSDTDVMPDFERNPELGFRPPPETETSPQPLAVGLQGVFESYYREHDPPAEEDVDTESSEESEPSGDTQAEDSRTESRPTHVIERSPAEARLAVVGSASFVDDQVLTLSRQMGNDQFLDNLLFVQNLVDWAVADTDLLAIRSGGSYARTLNVSPDARRTWEWINYAISACMMIALVVITRLRRRTEAPIELGRPREGLS